MNTVIQNKTKCNKTRMFLKKISYGRNNRGIITSRSRQSSCFKNTCIKNNNYTYLFLNLIKPDFESKQGIYASIINSILDKKTNVFLFEIKFLNSILKNTVKYISATHNKQIGDILVFGLNITPTIGNIMPIHTIPVGSYIHNIESIPTKGAVFVKTSKKNAFLVYKGDKYVTIKLPSGELRLLSKYVLCIYGELKINNIKRNLFKAGVNRQRGKRPIVRGVAKNACDHPHGGGEGKNSIGRKSCLSPWGTFFRGIKTRSNKKYSEQYILKKA